MVKATFSLEEWTALMDVLPQDIGEHIDYGIIDAIGYRNVGPRALVNIRLPQRMVGQVLTRAGQLGFCINVRPA